MAASSSSLRKIGEEKGKNCNGGDSDSSESDMIEDSPVPQPERRVKVRENGQNGKKQRKWEVPARLVSRKLSMVMSSVFGRWKSAEKICPKPGDGEKNPEPRGGGGEKGKSLKQRMMMRHWKGKKVSFSFGSLLSKKTRLKLIRRKITSGGSHERSRIVKIAMVKDAGRVNLANILRKRALRRRMRRTAPKLGGKEKEEEEEEEETEEGDAELCNKKILMGEKCRPLLPE